MVLAFLIGSWLTGALSLVFMRWRRPEEDLPKLMRVRLHRDSFEREPLRTRVAANIHAMQEIFGILRPPPPPARVPVSSSGARSSSSKEQKYGRSAPVPSSDKKTNRSPGHPRIMSAQPQRLANP